MGDIDRGAQLASSAVEWPSQKAATAKTPGGFQEMQDLTDRLTAAPAKGLAASVWADVKRGQTPIFDKHGETTFDQVNAAANRVTRLLRAHGLVPGDAVALLCSNRAEFVQVLSGCLRGGFRITPVNWHLNTDEVEYIINDCEAKALIAETRYPSATEAKTPKVVLRLSIGDEAEGFIPFSEAIAAFDGADIADPVLGNQMLYTSGTTGRPKGVFRRNPVAVLQPGPGAPDDVQLCAGPAYHAAPLAFDVRAAMAQGNPLVFLDRWDSEGVLATIERYRVTRAHMVPIMFQRLLALPQAVKARYDISCLRFIV